MKPTTTIAFMVLITSLTNGFWSGAEEDLLQGGSLAKCECGFMAKCECGFKCNGKYCVCKTCNDKKSNLGIENDLEDSNPNRLGKSKMSTENCRDCIYTTDQFKNCEEKCTRMWDNELVASGECLFDCFKDECKCKFCQC